MEHVILTFVKHINKEKLEAHYSHIELLFNEYISLNT